ncbi:cytochrome c oxidase accessory protein CcoG [Undibacterium luofuense]|uniref:Cytochrome c oxidase accessory protein CcoG n=1 Tax=Undibacterium luofuense TaxID=2828733 RepID=A0A941DJW0_9BURK|nr:cytochrome c oxidase accessory protein CcoG [Undibacterium luofuense]MBR7781320.1 cytochrome c oxidase accessory protein CcoG [Undibacterium luofuense]
MHNPATPQYKTISVYTKFEPFYVRESQGRFTNLRWLCVLLTQMVFFITPWLSWNQRQAVLLDLAARKFYLFGLILYPHDLIYLAMLLIICAFGLFLVTTIAGRVWCGYGCPQSVYTLVMMWIENRTEGNRANRMRLAREGWTAERILRTGSKHLIWLTLSFISGFVFTAWFVPVSDMLQALTQFRFSAGVTTSILLYGGLMYANAGLMRDQFCRYLCPYARFQGSMLDQDSLIISYHPQRGEPRQKPGADRPVNADSCIDCGLCVQVCPSGIDIRKGLQHDCTGCAACIDACDHVMDKLQLPRGLISYSSARQLQESRAGSASPDKPRFLRPRIAVYSLLMLIMCAAAAYLLANRPDVRMDILPDRMLTSREPAPGQFEQVYRLHLLNTREETGNYDLSIENVPALHLQSDNVIRLSPAGAGFISVTVRNTSPLTAGHYRFRFTLRDKQTQRTIVTEPAMFRIPA